MAGASSEDIRLSDTLTVIPYPGFSTVLPGAGAAGIVAASDPASEKAGEASLRPGNEGESPAGNSVWTGKAGDFLTLPVTAGKAVSGLAVSWKDLPDEPVRFEIQLSSGGGQFLTVWEGEAEAGDQTCSFDGTLATDCRLLLKSASASVSGVRLLR